MLFLLQLDRTLWLVFPLSIFFPFPTMDPLLPSRGEREGGLEGWPQLALLLATPEASCGTLLLPQQEGGVFAGAEQQLRVQGGECY